mmetsp:Transcript_20782/g.46535  ORF Transcript_20782/g.46535 Transcript_20782/m.46535 type:complete len:389 (-) Transcript_20782:258-1424(-)
MGRFTPICPASTSCTNLRAAAPERVKIAVPFPYGLALISAMASSRFSAGKTCSTGPKTSVLYKSILGFTLSTIVGPTQLPSGRPSTAKPRPSSGTVAPSLSPLLMSRSIFCLAAGEMTGGTSTPERLPGPTLRLDAISTNVGTHSRALPTRMTREIAMHRCPAAPKAAPVSALMATRGSVSSRTTAWFCAPRFACTRLPCDDPRWCTCAPAVSEPTKEIALISGASVMKLTALCVPCMMLRTPFGSPASSASSARRMAVSGTRSDGLRMNVFPQTIDMGNIHSGIIAGKLKGAIPAHTPRGTRYEWMSTPVATFCIVSPIWREVVLQACSTTSRPRKISPFASSMVLPCSAVRICASSSVCSRMSACSLNMTRVRLETDVLAQPDAAA